jgi:hypothetical protein
VSISPIHPRHALSGARQPGWRGVTYAAVSIIELFYMVIGGVFRPVDTPTGMSVSSHFYLLFFAGNLE